MENKKKIAGILVMVILGLSLVAINASAQNASSLEGVWLHGNPESKNARITFSGDSYVYTWDGGEKRGTFTVEGNNITLNYDTRSSWRTTFSFTDDGFLRLERGRGLFHWWGGFQKVDPEMRAYRAITANTRATPLEGAWFHVNPESENARISFSGNSFSYTWGKGGEKKGRFTLNGNNISLHADDGTSWITTYSTVHNSQLQLELGQGCFHWYGIYANTALIAAEAGELVITNIPAAFNGRYISAQPGFDNYPFLVAADSLSDRRATGGIIRNGSVTLKVWQVLAGTSINFNGNDTVELQLCLLSQSRYDPWDFNSDWSLGKVTVTFSGGKASASLDFIGTFVPANRSKGFNYGYYYYIPRITGNAKTYILVEPNNTGTSNDNLSVHDNSANQLINRIRPLADELNAVLLVPVFPRPRNNIQMYTHALNRLTLQNRTGNLARIDLQLIRMVEDLKEKCQSLGINVEQKILLNGFSASGSYVNRFTAIHPELVQAVVSGGINGMPILPVDVIEGKRMIYPVGIADLQEITGNPFNLAQYKTVPQFIYMGAQDTNDTLPFQDAFGNAEKQLIVSVLGNEMMPGRWVKSQSIYNELGINATFRTYEGVGHEITSQIERDIIAFFRRNM